MMKCEISKDIEIICLALNLTKQELANKIAVPFETISRIVNGHVEPSKEILEKFYGFSYNKGIRLNQSKVDVYKKNHNVVLFHGSKKGIIGDLSLDFSRDDLDIGRGFYTTENYLTALEFVSTYDDSSVYVLDCNNTDLKILKIDVSLDWMLCIAYNRGLLEDFKNTKKYQQISVMLDSFDVIIAPIADNRMFDTIELFVDGGITSETAVKALNSLHLGNQIVFKSEKAIQHLKILECLYLSKPEKEDALKLKVLAVEEGVNNARDIYRNNAKQGLTVGEVFE